MKRVSFACDPFASCVANFQVENPSQDDTDRLFYRSCVGILKKGSAQEKTGSHCIEKMQTSTSDSSLGKKNRYTQLPAAVAGT